MHGIGELFGSAFDDVIRRPTPAIVPALVDVGLLLVGAIVASASLGVILFFQAPQGLAVMPFVVPDALPSVSDLRDHAAIALTMGPRGWLAVLGVAAIAVPITAYARGGFVGLLLEVYLPRRNDDPLARPPQGVSELQDAFLKHAHASFGPLLLIGALEAAVAALAVILPGAVPYFRNSFLGLIVFHFLFLFAPYIVVVEGRGAWSALRESVRTVSDYLASSLVAVLFGLLTTGGLGALLTPALDFLGPAGLLVGAVLFAPVGTVLSLFYLKVYLSFRGSDRLPARAHDAPAAAKAPSEA